MRLPLSGTPAGASRISATCPTPCSPIAVRTSSALASPELLDTTTVATVDGQIAGFIVTNRDEIEQLYVASDHRGSSIAAALLEHGEQVISAEHELAFLAVVDANSRARRFYERNGWHDAGPFELPRLDTRRRTRFRAVPSLREAAARSRIDGLPTGKRSLRPSSPVDVGWIREELELDVVRIAEHQHECPRDRVGR